MKAISKYFAMCAIALLGLANTSCMSDDIESTAACDYSVVLDYKVGGSATETRATVTRAEEVGNDNLNENLINRLDLFIFKTDGSVKQVTFDGTDVQGNSPTTEYKHKELTELTRSDIDGNKLYLVANLENWGNINNLADLQKATINQAAFQHNQKQDAFVMDAKMLEREVTAGKIHLKFQLKRALAKIRLNVKDASGNPVVPTEYACQLINYAADGSIIEEGTCADNKLTKAAAVATPNLKVEGKAVFYSYANSWIDKSKDPKVEEPIDVSKQTYILLKAKFNNNDYFYKVPVNKRLYEDNDEATADGKPNWANYEPLYRLDRNTIYDVTATVDREGGSDPEHPAELNVLPTVLPWETGAEYTFNDAISIKTNIEKKGENSSEIKFNNATFGPKISFTEMNTNGKSWVLQTDSPDYGFIYADKVVNADGSYDLADVMTVITGNDTTTEVKPFYVVPRSVLDYTQRDNYTCHVYMVAYSPNMKVIINAPSDGSEGTATGTGKKTEMVFTQVK